MYSFAPDLRIFNGELQAVSGIGELAALWSDRRAFALFRRGERGAREAVAAADTGAWSLYSLAGREATLDYHRLIAEFLGDMCTRTDRRVYCDARARFARYEQEPTRIGVAPLRRLHARRATTVRFSISKVSDVRVRVWRAKRLTLRRDLTLPHGATRARLDAARARALRAADRGTGPERPDRGRGPQLPRRAAQAETEAEAEAAAGACTPAAGARP